MFNLVDDIPEFEPLSSTANDLELWNDITHQAAWLQNDMGYNFDQSSDQKWSHGLGQIAFIIHLYDS